MPITLEKLFSPTATVSFLFLDETVNVVWSPFRYTGEMQELAERLSGEMKAEEAEIAALREDADAEELEAIRVVEDDPDRAEALRIHAGESRREAASKEIRLDHKDKAILRDVLAKLLVSWDVLDGRTPVDVGRATLDKLPDIFLRVVFISLSEENQPDPPKAPSSNEPSSTDQGSAPSPIGTSSSGRRKPSASRRSSSTNGRKGRAGTRRGGIGPS